MKCFRERIAEGRPRAWMRGPLVLGSRQLIQETPTR